MEGLKNPVQNNDAANKNYVDTTTISKPLPISNFEYDILSQTSVGGIFDYRTPNSGVTKLVNIMSAVTIPNNTTLNIQLQGAGAESFSTSTDFPLNVKNQLPGQNPQTDKASFLPFVYDSTTNRWLENAIEFQVHLWRITVDYTRVGTAGNRELFLSFVNPNSGFSITDRVVEILPNGSQFVNNAVTFNFTTIADTNSIGSGYELILGTVGVSLTINNIEIVRTSLEKLS